MRRLPLLALAFFVACKSDAQPEAGPMPQTGAEGPASDPSTPTEVEARAPTDARATLHRLHEMHLAANPTAAVSLGLHAFDGKLPDVSPRGLAADRARLDAAIETLEGMERASLGDEGWLEREVLLQEMRGRRFDLVDLDRPSTNPMFYMDALNLVPYISRDYAPIEARVAAIASIAKATPAYLEAAKANLAPELAESFVDTAILQARGLRTFVETDVPAALRDAPEVARQSLEMPLKQMAAALGDYVTFLEGRKAAAHQDFALGPERFRAMLAATQGLDIELDRLQAIAEADLKRNYDAIVAAAKAIDPKAKVAEVVARVQADKPAADAVLQRATEQSKEMRAFLVEKKIVSIPFEDEALLRESPPFMRWNAAFLDGAGPFEKGALPSFYYISPPDPSWPEAEQRAYIPGTTDLLFITIHEVWPGHFLHGLHLKKHPSEVVKSYWNYAMGEGWAHYTEEMMWTAGISEDERVHVGQLLNALLRNVRFLSAIGLHTGQMTVADAENLFAEMAFQDPGNARQQAVRGTFDPMYLSYTVGKLMIRKLRDDYRAKVERSGKFFDRRAFHDELLSYAAAPLPVIRRAMLGDDAGPAL